MKNYSWSYLRNGHSGHANRDPESSPAAGGINSILDSGFRRDDE